MDQEYRLGIEEIDRQHEELLDRMELLRDYMRRGKSRDAIRDTLKFLETYAVDHFSTEVRYMERHHYPDIVRHKGEHEIFLSDLTALREKFTAMEAQGEITTFLSLDIVRKLNDWFTNHIATIDKKMGEYLATKREAQ